MKVKRKFLIVTIIVFVVQIALLCDSFAFVAYSKQEFKLSKEITLNEIEQFTAYNPSLKLQLLYNIKNEAEYIMAYNDNGGYEIYSRISGELLEANFTSDNPYKDIEKGYYLSVLTYAYNDNNSLKEIKTGHTYTKSEKERIIVNSERIKEKHINKRKTKQYSINDSIPNVDLNDISFNFSITDLSSFTSVSHPEVFMQMYDNAKFGDNTAGSCTVVASTLLYQYADYVYGGVIPALPLQSWINATNGHIVIGTEKIPGTNQLQTYDCTMTYTSNLDYTGSNLHKYLIYLTGAETFGVSDGQMLSAISSYNNEVMNRGCIYINTFSTIQTSVSNVYNTLCNSLIVYKMPMKISIFSNNKETGRHAVVAYACKYDTEYNSYYFRIHTGWENPNNCVINGDFLNVSEGHSMYNIVPTAIENHVLSTAHHCNNNNCFFNGTTHKYYSNNQNQHICVCGSTGTHFRLAINVNDQSNITFPSGYSGYCVVCFG